MSKISRRVVFNLIRNKKSGFHISVTEENFRQSMKQLSLARFVGRQLNCQKGRINNDADCWSTQNIQEA